MQHEELKLNTQTKAQLTTAYNELKEKLKEEYKDREPTREELLNYIKKNKIAETVVNKISNVKAVKKEIVYSDDKVHADDSVQLEVKVLSGRDFPKSPGSSSLICDIAFMGQRYIGEEVKSSESPVFNQSFIFTIQGPNEKVNLEKWLSTNIPLHFIIIEQDETNKKNLIAVKRIEWRHTLYAQSVEQEVTFNSMELQTKTPLGVLIVHLYSYYRFK